MHLFGLSALTVYTAQQLPCWSKQSASIPEMSNFVEPGDFSNVMWEYFREEVGILPNITTEKLGWEEHLSNIEFPPN